MIITSTLLHHHSYTPSRRTCWQGLWFFTQLSPSTVFHSHSGRSEPSDPQFPARNLSLKKWLVFCLNTLQGFPHLLKVFNLAYQPQNSPYRSAPTNPKLGQLASGSSSPSYSTPKFAKTHRATPRGGGRGKSFVRATTTFERNDLSVHDLPLGLPTLF